MTRTLHLFVTAAAVLGLSAGAGAQGGKPIEPVDIPPSIEQGVDMIYIDPEIRGGPPGDVAQDMSFERWTGAPVDMFLPVHPIYTELRRGLVRYQRRWRDLPQVELPGGAALKPGSTGERVALLRERLGLVPGTLFDSELAEVVKEYQAVHGLKTDGIVAAGTIASLNLGSEHYERVLIINLERARRLPSAEGASRYVLVDAGSARLWMYENGRPVDSMRVIVGTAETETPMMAALMRYAAVNPYWNVPPELVQTMVAPKVLAQGMTYLTERKYEVLSDWTDTATPLDPATVNWQAVADGKETIRLRRGPGPGNSMGDIKFMMPNDFGIYLHDYPDKTLFTKDDRWISNGCVRLEDAHRFAKWLFGEEPKGRDPNVEERVDLPEPVPVYMTYLTVASSPQGVVFRADPYKRDAAVLARYFGPAGPTGVTTLR